MGIREGPMEGVVLGKLGPPSGLTTKSGGAGPHPALPVGAAEMGAAVDLR